MVSLQVLALSRSLGPYSRQISNEHRSMLATISGHLPKLQVPALTRYAYSCPRTQSQRPNEKPQYRYQGLEVSACSLTLRKGNRKQHQGTAEETQISSDAVQPTTGSFLPGSEKEAAGLPPSHPWVRSEKDYPGGRRTWVGEGPAF